MDYDLDEFLAEYDDYTLQVRLAKLNIFPARLAQWFELIDNGEESVGLHIRWLESQIDWPEQQNIIFKSQDEILLPSKKIPRLAAYLNMMREIHEGETDFLPFIHTYFQNGRNIQAAVERFIDQFFRPFSDELRRYIERYFDEGLPEDSVVTTTVAAVPLISASDRLVPINHNAPEYQSLITGLEGLEEQLRGVNAVSPEDRELALSEVAAVQGLLKSPSVRWNVLTAFVVPTLVLVGQLLFDTIGAELINQTIMPSLKALFPGLMG